MLYVLLQEVGRMMDLGTVKKWLEWKEYSSPDEFGRDVRQVSIENAG